MRRRGLRQESLEHKVHVPGLYALEKTLSLHSHPDDSPTDIYHLGFGVCSILHSGVFCQLLQLQLWGYWLAQHDEAFMGSCWVLTQGRKCQRVRSWISGDLLDLYVYILASGLLQFIISYPACSLE